MAGHKDIGGTVTRIYNQGGDGGYVSVPDWPIQIGNDGTIRVLTPRRFAEFEGFLQFPIALSIDQIRQAGANLLLGRFIDKPVSSNEAPHPILTKNIALNSKPSSRIIKMTKSFYADQMVQYGKIRLGSVDEYMGFDHPEIGDKTEGKCIFVVAAPTQTNFFQFRGGLNEWVFCCFCGDFDQDVVSKFGYDAAVEITDPFGFLKTIEQHLGIDTSYFSECVYGDARFLINYVDSNLSASNAMLDFDKSIGLARAFIKHSRFSHQQEIRFVWPVPKSAERSIDLCCPEITKFCKRIA